MSLKYFFLSAFLALGFAVIAPATAEATAMSCDTSIRTTYESTKTGFNLKEAWNKQTSSYNAYICAAAQMEGREDPNCYDWRKDPKNPFVVISSNWGSWEYPDERPLEPPEYSDPNSMFPYTQTTWNSCAKYCSTIEDGQYCIGLGAMCHVVKLKPGHSPSTIRSIAITQQGATYGCGYGVLCSSEPSTSWQAGVCTPRPPTAALTATPATINSGNSSLLVWNSYNADSCTGVGFNTGGAKSGSVNVSPSSTTNYQVNCTGGAGPASASATVTVLTQTPPAPPTGLTAQCDASGNSVTLSWSQPAGATSYFIRMDDPTNNSTSCADGWFCADPPDKKTDGYAGTSITYPIVPNRSYSWWVHGANGNGIGTASTAGFSCAVAAVPDLTPAGISPTTATAGNSTTVTATISNIGGSVANANQTYIRVAGSKGNLYADTTNVPAIQAGSSGTVTFNVTLPSEGSYPVEVCADQNGTVTESNEGNNCATYNISVAPRPISNSVSCEISSRNVNVGGSATYSTSVSGSAGAPYSWSSPQGGGPFGNNATVERTFLTPGTYQMMVSASGASAAATCPVVNVSLCPGTRSATITATPNRVAQNGTATLNWNATAINTSCIITGPGVNQRVNSSSCTVPDGSVVTPAITTQSTYTISCDNGAVTDTAIVNVIPQFEEF